MTVGLIVRNDIDEVRMLPMALGFIQDHLEDRLRTDRTIVLLLKVSWRKNRCEEGVENVRTTKRKTNYLSKLFMVSL